MPHASTLSSCIALTLVLIARVASGGVTSDPVVGHPSTSRDALWRIVEECVDPGARTCTCPALLAGCCGTVDTPPGDVIWGLSSDFVVIRNKTACGCAPDFVSGLAIPRTKVSGLEDPRRPDGIWPFAWRVAVQRIGDKDEIALAVNPASLRSQDQLHVHLLRLNAEGRELLSNPPRSSPALQVVALKQIDEVFAEAARTVGEQALWHTGLLVARARSGDGWTMLLFDNRSPKMYTRHSCNRGLGRFLSNLIPPGLPRVPPSVSCR